MLPATTDDLLFSCLSAGDLHRYAQSSKSANQAVASYRRRAFQLGHILGAYFTSQQILEFRRLQFETGMFISGSTALQFFDRTVYPESDLDLYVERRFHAAIALWIEQVGYAYVPPAGVTAQSAIFTLVQALNVNAPPDDHFFDIFPQRFHSRTMPEYLGASFIYNFQKSRPIRRIQLIISDMPPMEMILNFHSTCVMNLITHDTAYSLYPRATFEDRRSLVHDAETPERQRALMKYEDRGWNFIEKITVKESRDPHSAFSVGMRYLGDKKCWTLPLSPKLDRPAGHMETHTWTLSYDATLDMSVRYTIFLSRKLRFRYLVDNRLSKFVYDWVKKAKSADEQLDDSLRLLMMSSDRDAFV